MVDVAMGMHYLSKMGLIHGVSGLEITVTAVLTVTSLGNKNT